jgi:hypothetical protein
MQTKFFSVTETVDELERRFGIRVNPQTVRIWCRRFGFGVRLAPNGHYQSPKADYRHWPMLVFAASRAPRE